VAQKFTDEHLEKVASLLSDDYKIGFKEGIEKYLTYREQMKKAQGLTHKMLFTVGQEDNPIKPIVKAVLEKEFSEIETVMDDARELLTRIKDGGARSSTETEIIIRKLTTKLDELQEESHSEP